MTIVVLAAVIVVGVLLLSSPADSSAQGPPTVRVELERPTVDVGDEFDVFIYIEDARRLGGFQFTLGYDEAYVTYVSSTVTDWLASTGREITVLGPVEEPGLLSLGALTLGATSQPGPDGDGDLASVRFRAVSEGRTDLDLTQVLLVDTSNVQTEVEGEDGVLVIGGGGGTPVPSATPSATSAATGTTTPTISGTPTITPGTTAVPGGHHVYLPASYSYE